MSFWRKRPDAPPLNDPIPSEATRARRKAERDLEATKAETPKIRELAQALIEIQKVNHLGATAARVLRGEK